VVFDGALYGRDHIAHHQIAVDQRVILRPVHCADIVLEVLCALRQVGEVLVRQVDHPLAHVLLRQFDEEGSEAIAHAARPRVQQKPDVLVSIKADLDEMVPGTQSTQVLDPLNMVQLGVLLDDRVVRRLHRGPLVHMMRGGV
jgi:hypothetical protein